MKILGYCVYCSTPFTENSVQHKTPSGPCCSECRSSLHWQDGKQDEGSEILEVLKEVKS